MILFTVTTLSLISPTTKNGICEFTRRFDPAITDPN